MEITKQELRLRMKAERGAMSPDEVTLKSAVISQKLSVLLREKKSVMAYCAMFNEINVDPLMRALIADGRSVAVPVTDKKTSVITPSAIESLEEIKRGAYGIREPINRRTVHKDAIEAVVVPGLAFGRDGSRMGYGKGCYDRFLADYRGLKIGVCHEFQLFDSVPTEAFDIPMDIIVTESDVYAV